MASGYYVGEIIILLSALMVIPLATSLLSHEIAVALDFGLSMATGICVGLLLMVGCYRFPRPGITWVQGMIVVSLVWLLGMLVAALPYYLSGQWASYLDACFDVMSGFTTTGLVLVQDLDHASNGINMWRHLLTWLGGQGMIVLALTFFFRGLPGAFRMYVGEGKDERLMPSVTHTVRAIWYISVIYLVIGTLVLWIEGWALGLSPSRAFLHGLWVFMAAWSTGGFSPQSQNILYYHSLVYEVTTMLFFVIGSLNFNLHWAIWTGNRKEMYRNLETVTFFVTSTLLALLAVVELSHRGVYSDALALFRRGYYTIISAHTTTGFMTTYARQLILDWGPLALWAATLAMLFGGSASSTAGGFKALRIGIAIKAIVQDIRRLLLPERAVVTATVHLGHDITLEERHVRSALVIIVLYFVLWAFTAGATAFCGYDLASSLFEAASATGNVGLSCGVTSPAMPNILKTIYIGAMWLGRLEFMAVLVFVAQIYRTLRGRWA